MDMHHKSEPFLELTVELDLSRIVGFSAPGRKVWMLPFYGTAHGPIFEGIIEPCGVDTQVTDAAGVKHMSARYMLTGKDSVGQDCHIFVENEGWTTDGTKPNPFYTVPKFLTDSEALAPFLHRNCFLGEGSQDETGLHIRFFETNTPQESPKTGASE